MVADVIRSSVLLVPANAVDGPVQKDKDTKKRQGEGTVKRVRESMSRSQKEVSRKMERRAISKKQKSPWDPSPFCSCYGNLLIYK